MYYEGNREQYKANNYAHSQNPCTRTRKFMILLLKPIKLGEALKRQQVWQKRHGNYCSHLQIWKRDSFGEMWNGSVQFSSRGWTGENCSGSAQELWVSSWKQEQLQSRQKPKWFSPRGAQSLEHPPAQCRAWGKVAQIQQATAISIKTNT